MAEGYVQVTAASACQEERRRRAAQLLLSLQGCHVGGLLFRASSGSRAGSSRASAYASTQQRGHALVGRAPPLRCPSWRQFRGPAATILRVVTQSCLMSVGSRRRSNEGGSDG